jgi:hypothetical protein
MDRRPTITALTAMIIAAGLSGCATMAHTNYRFDAADWIYNSQTKHYYRMIEKMDWTVARDTAESLGGYLVTINDAEENAWLLETLKPQEAVWIGFNDLRIEGRWEWVNGEQVTYTNWRPGQPGNTGGKQHCGTMHSVNTPYPGQWNDDYDRTWRRAIVERDSR